MANKFAGGDPDYIRTTQYGTPEKLSARQRLHSRYRTAPVRWFEWMAAEIPWQPGTVVEVGCGPGDFWDEARPPIDGRVVLTDLSAGMVAAAIGRARGAGYDAEGRVAPAQSLPIVDAAAAHVVSNHMLYHVPHPPDGVAEMARIVADDGLVTVATNGENHMAELKQIERAVFDTDVADSTVRAFGLENGRAMLEAHFESVELRATDPQHVVDYLSSYPPGEDATASQYDAMRSLVDAGFAAGDGVFTIRKDAGMYLCRGPRRG